MANPVTVQDVADRWKPMSNRMQTATAAYLDDAWGILLSEVPNLEANIAAETVDVAVVRSVVCAAVLRVVRNINSFEQVEIDDYKPRFNDGATGVLEFTSRELARLEPSTSSAASYTIIPYDPAGA